MIEKYPDILWAEFKRNQDAKSFKVLFNHFFTPLCRYSILFLKDSQDAEEVVLDLFIYLWRHQSEIDIKTSIDSYMYRSVRNRSLNVIRTKHPSISLEEAEYLTIPENLHGVDISDISEILELAVDSLPPRCREVFCKSRKENMSNAEIAQDMGISNKTVEAQMTRALKQLRIIFKKFYLLSL